MSNFDLSNYKTVPERIAEARKAFPDGRFQTEILYLPPGLAEKYVAVKARFFRTADDPTPGEGIAWEVVPGKTPYTKDSELQNCETSAWGRALVAAFAVDASKGIASREEIQSRQTPRPRTKAPASPPTAPVENGELDMAKWATKQKLRLVEALGDKDKARDAWAAVLRPFGLDHAITLPEEMKDAIEVELAVVLVNALPEDQKPFV